MVDVILLISGGSKRMGREKALLPFSHEETFVSHLLKVYLGIEGAKLIVVMNKENQFYIQKEIHAFKDRVELVVNPNPDQGRLASIRIGLAYLKKGNGVFIQNIDNPFVNIELIKAMLANYKTNTFLVPRHKEKNGHPLLLGAELIQEMKSSTITDLKTFLNNHLKEVYITSDKGVLANINNPDEYQKWFSNQLVKNSD